MSELDRGTIPRTKPGAARRPARTWVGLFVCAMLVISVTTFVVGWFRPPRAVSNSEAAPAQIPETHGRQPDTKAVTPTSQRSPIPLLGETFDRPFPPRLLRAKNPDPIGAVEWHQAHRFLGQTITIKGKVVDARNTGTVCFLNFHRNWQDKFYVIIFESSLHSWDEPPQEYFLNQQILVAGKVTQHKGRPQIRIQDPSQIVIAKPAVPRGKGERKS